MHMKKITVAFVVYKILKKGINNKEKDADGLNHGLYKDENFLELF